MSSPASNLESLQGKIGRLAKKALLRVHLGSYEEYQEIIIDDQVKVIWEAMTSWTVSLNTDRGWITVYHKPCGTIRPMLPRASREYQEQALETLRRHMILDELADV